MEKCSQFLYDHSARRHDFTPLTRPTHRGDPPFVLMQYGTCSSGPNSPHHAMRVAGNASETQENHEVGQAVGGEPGSARTGGPHLGRRQPAGGAALSVHTPFRQSMVRSWVSPTTSVTLTRT